MTKVIIPSKYKVNIRLNPQKIDTKLFFYRIQVLLDMLNNILKI